MVHSKLSTGLKKLLSKNKPNHFSMHPEPFIKDPIERIRYVKLFNTALEIDSLQEIHLSKQQAIHGWGQPNDLNIFKYKAS